MKPTNADIDNAIDAIERHERWSKPTLIELATSVWQSDAQKHRLPLVNIIDKGVPLLDRDAVIRSAEPDYAPRVEVGRQRLTGRLLGWLRGRQ